MQAARAEYTETTGTEIAIKRKLSDTLHEYESKVKAIKDEIKAFEDAGKRLRTASSIGGTYSQVSIDVGHVYERTIQESLLKSAWLNIYEYLSIDSIASADDKKRFQQSMADPPEFTLENIRASFGDYVLDPYSNILRGLAEVFCKLDDSYKSHDKVKIGVHGLPKRIILSSVTDFGWGKDRIIDVINALAAVQSKPQVTYPEINGLLKDESYLLESRGIKLRRFKNGNAHLFFEPQELLAINTALAEYYGEVLPDCREAQDEHKKKNPSTALAKDLQYFPTPVAIVERVLDDLYIKKDELVLEPSCGCGRFMDGIRKRGARVLGIEVDSTRAQIAKDKGHKVLEMNFLETLPEAKFDRVIMNPPFYGQHYMKHIEHAMKFLKAGGTITAILPATAAYDHGTLDKYNGTWQKAWRDLPVGAFKESGTNINTIVFTYRKPD